MIWSPFQDQIDRMDRMDDLHVVLMLYQDQPNDKYKFDGRIRKFQERMKDPDPESVHVEWGFVQQKMMFSSSGRGGLFSGHGLWLGVGTRFEDMSRIDPEKWKIFATNITKTESIMMYRMAERLAGKRYDWLGIIGQPFKINIHGKKSWYCSEVCHHIGYNCITQRTTAERLPEMKKIRPGQMVKIYQDANILLDRINYSDIIQ